MVQPAERGKEGTTTKPDFPMAARGEIFCRFPLLLCVYFSILVRQETLIYVYNCFFSLLLYSRARAVHFSRYISSPDLPMRLISLSSNPKKFKFLPRYFHELSFPELHDLKPCPKNHFFSLVYLSSSLSFVFQNDVNVGLIFVCECSATLFFLGGLWGREKDN